MKFFGDWAVHDCPNDKDLWLLDNPVGPDVWGVLTDDGREVVPCDHFVFDLASTKKVRLLWPQHWGRKAATYHDWGYRAHRVSFEELMIELKPWFEYKRWSTQQRVDYINWLRNRSRSEWDRDFYVLTGYEGICPLLRRAGYVVVSLLGGLHWNRDCGNRTRIYRETKSMEAASA